MIKQVNMKLEEEDVIKLDELCKLSGTSRNVLFSTMIRSEHDKLQGSPKIKEALEQMRILAEKFKELQG